MKEWHSAEEIGVYNFTHWTNQPVTPGKHEIVYVPQSVLDGWQAYCSCGEWKGFFSLWDVQGKDAKRETFDALKSAWMKHASR